MPLFSRKIPEYKYVNVVLPLFSALANAGDHFFPTFLSYTAVKGLPPSLNEIGRHYISMLQLSAVASTIVENRYVSDPIFFLELIYIGITGRRPEEMHTDIAEYNSSQPASEVRVALKAWASTMAKELLGEPQNANLVTELVGLGGLLAAQAKILTCEACGHRRGAKKVRAAMGL